TGSDDAVGDPFAAVVRKPARPVALLETLAALLGRGELSASARPGGAFDGALAARRPLRILVVEDNATNEQLAVRVLERLGYRPDVARDGAEAVRAVERERYDVVFMDVQMPEVDGYEATRRIVGRRAPGERPRIVAITAHASGEDRAACLDAGM